jgi:hypothetical protein
MTFVIFSLFFGKLKYINFFFKLFMSFLQIFNFENKKNIYNLQNNEIIFDFHLFFI